MQSSEVATASPSLFAMPSLNGELPGAPTIAMPEVPKMDVNWRPPAPEDHLIADARRGADGLT